MEKFFHVKRLDTPTNGENILYTARYVDTREKVIIKKCHKGKGQTQIEEEVMEIIYHPKIIKCYETFEINGYVYFVLEYAPKGNLYEKTFSTEEIKNIISQLISALSYCHRIDILHRDIKPENIVLFNDGSIKLIDFGWACFYDECDPPFEKAGTAIYSSPEMIKGYEYDYSIDVWQVGVLIYELLSQDIPFDGKNDKETRKQILKCKPKFPDYFSKEVVDLLKKILTPADNRIKLDEILQHSWFYT